MSTYPSSKASHYLQRSKARLQIVSESLQCSADRARVARQAKFSMRSGSVGPDHSKSQNSSDGNQHPGQVEVDESIVFPEFIDLPDDLHSIFQWDRPMRPDDSEGLVNQVIAEMHPDWRPLGAGFMVTSRGALVDTGLLEEGDWDFQRSASSSWREPQVYPGPWDAFDNPHVFEDALVRLFDSLFTPLTRANFLNRTKLPLHNPPSSTEKPPFCYQYEKDQTYFISLRCGLPLRYNQPWFPLQKKDLPVLPKRFLCKDEHLMKAETSLPIIVYKEKRTLRQWKEASLPGQRKDWRACPHVCTASGGKIPADFLAYHAPENLLNIRFMSVGCLKKSKRPSKHADAHRLIAAHMGDWVDMTLSTEEYSLIERNPDEVKYQLFSTLASSLQNNLSSSLDDAYCDQPYVWESSGSPQRSPLEKEWHPLPQLIKANRKKRIKILLPYENFCGALFGKEFQINRLIREETQCKVYSVTRLDNSKEGLEAKVFHLQGAARSSRQSRKRTIARVKNVVYHVKEAGKLFLVYQASNSSTARGRVLEQSPRPESSVDMNSSISKQPAKSRRTRRRKKVQGSSTKEVGSTMDHMDDLNLSEILDLGGRSSKLKPFYGILDSTSTKELSLQINNLTCERAFLDRQLSILHNSTTFQGEKESTLTIGQLRNHIEFLQTERRLRTNFNG
ncbi:unnamed protein product [Clonostachys solani]|uniref:Uncharacterized protein n=1 Tax=Clonostachys solani TaxID=160281 RepID=A0A9N9Z1I1_9HYPO|nr:unnamed protein product [Clonostachys solani]